MLLMLPPVHVLSMFSFLIILSFFWHSFCSHALPPFLKSYRLHALLTAPLTLDLLHLKHISCLCKSNVLFDLIKKPPFVAFIYLFLLEGWVLLFFCQRELLYNKWRGFCSQCGVRSEGLLLLPNMAHQQSLCISNVERNLPSPNPGTVRLPRTRALPTADARTAGSAAGTPHAPLSGRLSRCWGPAGTFSSLTPLFQKLCLRWTNQGTTENHSLAYRVTGISIKSGLLEPQTHGIEKDHR